MWFVLCCFIRYLPKYGLHTHIWLLLQFMFPPWNSQYCHPLPQVIGLTVSEYYEMIWIPLIHHIFFFWLTNITLLRRRQKGLPGSWQISICIPWFITPADPPESHHYAIPLYRLPARYNCRHLLWCFYEANSLQNCAVSSYGLQISLCTLQMYCSTTLSV